MKVQRIKQKLILLLLSVFIGLPVANSATYTVTKTATSGSGSLSDAISQSNSNPGADLITFNIPTSDAGYNATFGNWTIQLTALLPYLTGGDLTIDATTQTNQNPSGPEIVITTNNAASVYWAFGVFSGNNTIKGFQINGFSYGILISEVWAQNNLISNNYIGVNYNGTAALANALGIVINNNATNNTIKDNLISGNSNSGIVIKKASSNTIIGNKIGTDITGELSIENLNGITIDSASNTIIGGVGATMISERNLISGNNQSGVVISSRTSTNNLVQGNYIGVNITGDKKVKNLYGVSIVKAAGNIVGRGNLISGNTDIGVLITGKYARNNIVRGNLIGTDCTGTKLLDNHKGVIMKSLANGNLIGGKTPEDRNVVSGNLEIGIYIEAADSNKITGNYIGTDITGMNKVAIGHIGMNDSLVQGNGVEFNTVAKHNILGGYEYGERNIISGHKVYGVVYYGNCNNNHTINNFIGTDVTSKNALPNATGICFDCASNHNDVINCVLSGNIGYGLFYVTRGTYFNRLLGCMVGVDSSGTKAVPNDIGMVVSTGTAFNTIGGTTPAERNIFSGNNLSGLMITNQLTEHNSIKGNYFGTDITGTIAIPNLWGVMFSTFTKFNTLDGNLISGNLESGIIMNEEADSNAVINNKIGTDISGTLPLANGSGGIYLDYGCKHNIIGQISSPNIIAFNKAGGILVNQEKTKYNIISGNSIFDNEGLGIDIAPFGILNTNDAGDVDSGPSDMLNSPVIQSAIYDVPSANTFINGTVDCSSPLTTTIEVFIADIDNQGNVQGKTFVGIANPSANGSWSLASNMILATDKITATTIEQNWNTSEFAQTIELVTSDNQTENNLVSQIRIFPNPTSEYLTIDGLPENAKWSIYDVNGKLVKHHISKDNKWDLMDDNGNKVPTGQYIISVTLENGKSISKSLSVL
ncbi:MAG: T9SS type A sorting domain-containing protein [Bacteroidota bacterium]